jgi:hypothetical protein
MDLLYKYRSLSEESSKWTEKILTQKELYYAGVKYFNDPFDGRVFLKFEGSYDKVIAAQARVQYDMNLEEGNKTLTLSKSLNLVESKITSENIKDPIYKEGKLKKVQKLFDTKGVLSLASENTNILMWSHYGNNHNGICFGFDCSNEDVFKNLKKVRYQSHYEQLWGWLYTDDEIVNNILYTKSHQWSYENEYRCVKNNIGITKFKMESLKEIIFGCIVEKGTIDKFKALAIEEGFTGKFYKNTIDDEAYKLNLLEI